MHWSFSLQDLDFGVRYKTGRFHTNTDVLTDWLTDKTYIFLSQSALLGEAWRENEDPLQLKKEPGDSVQN